MAEEKPPDSGRLGFRFVKDRVFVFPAQSGRVAIGHRVVALGTAVVAPRPLIGPWSLNVPLASGSLNRHRQCGEQGHGGK
jgi:hypothetical protein